MSKRLIYSQVETRCWRCGVGEFKLLPGTKSWWECDQCKHVGFLKTSG
jgi:hypothetical protein